MSDDGIVQIHGKSYKTVARRISDFREDDRFKSFGVNTEILNINASEVVIKAVITNPDGFIVGTGIAHEVQGSSNINKTSHIENAETSAIGRALACIGLAGTDSYASADEVANAVSNQAIKEATKALRAHMDAVRDNLMSIAMIKNGMHRSMSVAAEAWFELDEDTKMALWRAPTKGGIFTTKEIEVIKSREFRESHFGPTEE